MQINFYPEYDNKQYEEAAKEYTEIWEQDGPQIIDVIENISGLKFRESKLNALVHDRNSGSHPFVFRDSYDLETKKNTIVHELCHRICTPKNTKFVNPDGDITTEVHKIIFLILYDAIDEIYGKIMADKEVQTTKSYGRQAYIDAWDFALSMNKKERAKMFATLVIR